MNKKILKYCISIILITVVITFTISVIFSEKIIKYQLENVLNKEFKGYYKINYKSINLDINLPHFSLNIDKPFFKTDTTSIGKNKLPIFYFEGEKLKVSKMNIWDLILGEHLKIESIILEKPILKLFLKEEKENKTSTKNNNLKFISIKQISINKANVKQINIQNKEEIYSSTNLYLNIKAALIDLSKLNKPMKAITFNNFILNSGENNFQPKASNYKYNIDSISINIKEKTLNASGLSLLATKNIEKISIENDNQTMIPEFTINNIKAKNLNYKRLLFKDTLSIDTLNIIKAEVKLYQNKTTHRDFKHSKLALSKIIQDIKLPIDVKAITLSDSDINLNVKVSKEKPPANIEFDKIKVIIKEFSTYQFDTLNIEANAYFQKEGELTLRIKIPYHDTLNYKQFYNGQLKNIKLSSLNSIIEAYIPLKITTGRLKLLNFKGVSNNKISKGYLTMIYDDLKLEVMGKHHKKSKSLSFIGNQLIRQSNPNHQNKLHTTTFNFEKKGWQNQTALIIGGILDGVIKTILIKPIQKQYSK